MSHRLTSVIESRLLGRGSRYLSNRAEHQRWTHPVLQNPRTKLATTSRTPLRSFALGAEGPKGSICYDTVVQTGAEEEKRRQPHGFNSDQTEDGNVAPNSTPPLPLRSTYSAGRSLDVNGRFSVVWGDLFNTLNRLRLEGRGQEQHLLAWHRSYASTFIDTTDPEVFRQKWMSIPEDQISQRLPSLLVGSLILSARQTLFVLSSLQWLPRDFRVRMECLHYLRQHYWKEINSDSVLQAQFADEITKQRQPAKWPKTDIPLSLLHLLLQNSTREEGDQIISSYLEIYKAASPNTVLYFVDHFTRNANVAQALSMLRRLPAQVLHDSEPKLLQRCMNLLAMDTITLSKGSRNFTILPRLLELGIRPNDLLHNLVVQNAVRGGLPSVAWDVFRYMQDGKLEVNARTHLILLRDAFLRQDVQGVNVVMSAIHQNKELARDPYIVAYTMNIIRNVCYYERQTLSGEAFSHILAIYDRAYNRTPLHRLGMVKTTMSSSGIRRLPQPNGAALAFTIWSYILVQRQTYHVSTLWQSITRLVTEGDRIIMRAAELDVIYNGFILFYSRSPSTMIKALTVLQYMLDSSHCAPTSKTWTLLICAFLKHGHEEQAERIRQMMHVRGMDTPEADWQLLFENHSKSKLAARVKSVLDERNMPEGLRLAMGAQEDVDLPFRDADPSTKAPATES